MNALNAEVPSVNQPSVWQRILPFIVLAFGLSWLLDLALALLGGYGSQQTVVVLQLQMLVPAACAILLGFVSTRHGPSGVRNSGGQARRFFIFFGILALLYVVLAVVTLAVPSLAMTLAGISTLLALLSAVVLVVLRLSRGKASFASAGLTFGKPIHWLVYGLGFILFYVAQTALNAVFGLGTAPDLSSMVTQSGMSREAFVVAAATQSVLLNSFLAIVIAFGEEYGWRRYLQDELVSIGRVRGVFYLGLIWGLWHAPVIIMGHNYPGYPVAGVVLMTAYTTLLAFVLGYVMLKTGSVWLVAFLHALNNQVYGTLIILAYMPNDPVYQFGSGIYGLVTLLVVVLLLLRDPIWKGSGLPVSGLPASGLPAKE